MRCSTFKLSVFITTLGIIESTELVWSEGCRFRRKGSHIYDNIVTLNLKGPRALAPLAAAGMPEILWSHNFLEWFQHLKKSFLGMYADIKNVKGKWRGFNHHPLDSYRNWLLWWFVPHSGLVQYRLMRTESSNMQLDLQTCDADADQDLDVSYVSAAIEEPSLNLFQAQQPW